MINQHLASIVSNGAGAFIAGRPHAVLAHAQVLPGNVLFYVPLFPQGTGDTHRQEFDKTTATDDQIVFFLAGEIVAHVAPYREFPEIETDQADQDWASWLWHLGEKDNRAAFESFVKAEAV